MLHRRTAGGKAVPCIVSASPVPSYHGEHKKDDRDVQHSESLSNGSKTHQQGTHYDSTCVGTLAYYSPVVVVPGTADATAANGYLVL